MRFVTSDKSEMPRLLEERNTIVALKDYEDFVGGSPHESNKLNTPPDYWQGHNKILSQRRCNITLGSRKQT